MNQELIDIEVFIPDLLVELPKCPVPALERRIRDAAIEACERAYLWRHQLPEIPVSIGQTCFDLPAPPGETRVQDVLLVLNNQCPMRNIQLENTVDNVYIPIPNTGQGYYIIKRGTLGLTHAPTRASSPMVNNIPPEVPEVPVDPSGNVGVTQAEIDQYVIDLAAYNAAVEALEIYNLPRATRGLDVQVSLKPTREANRIAECLYHDHYQLIIDGTLGYAYDMRDTPWYDPQEAAKRKHAFEYEIVRAKQAMDRGFSDRPLRVRPRKF